MTEWITRHFPRSWRENPLLLHEAGLVEGRFFWRAPLAVVLGLTLVWGIHSVVWYWLFYTAGLNRPWLLIHVRVNQGLLLLAWLVPVWLCARTWKRDRDMRMREQIAASPLTLRQLLEARVLLWLWVFSIVVVALHFADKLIQVGGLWAAEDSGWRERVLRPGLGHPGWQLLLAHAGNLALSITRDIAGHVMRLALATRVTLAWNSRMVSVVLAGAASWICNAGVLRAVTWLGGGIAAFSGFLLWYPAISLAAVLCITAAIWWGLPRHVGGAYGMETGRK